MTTQTPVEVVELDVADGATVQRQRFHGHQVARVEQTHDLRTITYRVFHTAKGQYAVYTVDRPDWRQWSRDAAAWEDPRTWTSDYYASRDRTLDVYPTLEAMLAELPDDIAETVRAAIAKPTSIDLDI